MGMRIGGGSNAWATQQSSSAINWQQRHQNFKSLKSAIQNNDLAGAQQAFAALSANNPQATANPNSPLAQLGQALQSGNMAAAQQVAQAWQNNQANNHTSNKQATDPNAALASFLQTLSASKNQTQTDAQSTPTGTTDSTSNSLNAPATSSPEQVAQALLAFERNLFDSLQLQNKNQSTSGSATSTTTTPVAADPAVADATAGLNPPPVNTASVQEQHHHHQHHHGGGGGNGQTLAADLNSLIAQNSTTTASTGNATGLDQSFKSLLANLGVSGNNASLNSFLQALSSNMQSTQA